MVVGGGLVVVEAYRDVHRADLTCTPLKAYGTQLKACGTQLKAYGTQLKAFVVLTSSFG